MKKIISLLIAMSMLLSLALPSIAADSNATAVNEDTALEPYIIYDAQTAKSPISRIYDKYYDEPRGFVEIGGRRAIPWGPKAENTLNMETVEKTYSEKVEKGTMTEEKAASSVKTIRDAWENYGDFANRPSQINVNDSTSIPMSKYQYLVIEMYSANNTNQPFLWSLYSQNSATSGDDFYKAGFNANWEGEWKTIKIALAGGLNDCGEFTKSRSPLGQPYEAKSIHLSPNTSSAFYPDTEVYIGKIYLEGNREAQTVANDKGEIILPDYYDPSTMTDYVSMVKAKHPNNHHPRLLVSDEIINRIKTYKNTDSFMQKAYAAVETKANTLLASDPDAAYTENSGVLKFSRNVENVASYCGLMYLLTGNEDYAARVWEEAEVMINSDELWYDTSTGLDSAHIANGMALAYDWCYDYLDRDQKLAIRNALMKHAFAYAQRVRGGSGYMGFRNNVVAANSKGFMTAALAICDEPGYEDFCNEFINNVVTYLPQNLGPQFVPDGAYSEGAGYWKYTVYSLMFMTDAMLTSIGSDGGIQEMPGLEKTGYFPIALRGTNRFFNLFNYSDVNKNYNQYISPVYHYLAKRYNLPAIRACHLANLEAYPSYYQMEDLLWYNPDLPYDTDWTSDLPKDYFLDGLEPIVSMRSGYSNTDNYIGAKGGNSKTGHDQYDAGTFVLDALGTRWIQDQGAGVYGSSTPDYYYYQQRAEGHNCIVFDPARGWADGSGQTVGKNHYDTKCPIVDSATTDGAAFSVLDLQPSYQETVKSYKRGFALISDRTQFVVQDEFETKEAFELYSYFHTSTNNSITINPDGRSLILQNGGNMCRVDFVTDIENFELGVMNAEVHPASPKTSDTSISKLSGVHKFYLHAQDVQKATITVVFTPMTSQSDSVTLPAIKALANWDEYTDEYDIYINSIDGNKVNITSEKAFSNAIIILAAYKEDALVAVKCISRYISKGTDDYTMVGFDAGDATEVKAFVWKDLSSTIKPLSCVFEK